MDTLVNLHGYIMKNRELIKSPLLFALRLSFRNDMPVTSYIQNVVIHLKVHKNENFFGFDFEFCIISMLVMHK
jgi:hypothetical protein